MTHMIEKSCQIQQTVLYGALQNFRQIKHCGTYNGFLKCLQMQTGH